MKWEVALNRIEARAVDWKNTEKLNFGVTKTQLTVSFMGMLILVALLGARGSLDCCCCCCCGCRPLNAKGLMLPRTLASVLDCASFLFEETVRNE